MKSANYDPDLLDALEDILSSAVSTDSSGRYIIRLTENRLRRLQSVISAAKEAKP